MTQATVTALNARLDAVASELDRMRHSRHRQQWPEGHPEDPGLCLSLRKRAAKGSRGVQKDDCDGSSHNKA